MARNFTVNLSEASLCLAQGSNQEALPPEPGQYSTTRHMVWNAITLAENTTLWCEGRGIGEVRNANRTLKGRAHLEDLG
jgi:hypothetical protein